MENATKALLIVAAVLIAIVLIATGVLLIKNISGTSIQANETGELLSNATDKASSDVIGGLKGTIISKEKFNDFINDFKKKYSNAKELIDEIQNVQNGKLSNQIEIIGYVYLDRFQNIKLDETEQLKKIKENYDAKDEEKNREYFEYIINVWIPKLKEEGKIKKSSNPLDPKEDLRKVYFEKKGNKATEEEFNDLIETGKARASWSFGYDEWGYINKAVYIGGLLFDY